MTSWPHPLWCHGHTPMMSWPHPYDVIKNIWNLIDRSHDLLLHADWSICTTWPISGFLIGRARSDPFYYSHTLLRFLKSNLRSSSTSVPTARNRSILHSVKTQGSISLLSESRTEFEWANQCSLQFIILQESKLIFKTKQLCLVAQCGK